VAVTPVRGGDPPVEGAPGSSVVTAPTVSGPVVYAAAGRAPVTSTPVVTVPIMSAKDGDPAGEGRDYAAEFLWGSRLESRCWPPGERRRGYPLEQTVPLPLGVPRVP